MKHSFRATGLGWWSLVVRNQPKHAFPVSNCGPQMALAFKAASSCLGTHTICLEPWPPPMEGTSLPGDAEQSRALHSVLETDNGNLSYWETGTAVPKDAHTSAGVTSLNIW